MPRKLQGRIDFQGLPISIENRKGSKRHWYDPHNETEGTTVMKYPYGYVKGTLGTDGDAVDVYVGPNKKSEKVFVVTQNKAPDFTQIDEQKVMLGFDSKDQAKLAYLAHYNDKRFLRNITELSIDVFKRKLESNKGKLIKGQLITDPEPVKIKESNLFNEFRLNQVAKTIDACRRKDNTMKTAAQAFDDVTKALTARIASGVANRARMQARINQYHEAHMQLVQEVPDKVGAGEAQPVIGTTRERLDGEPPVVPVRSIYNTVAGPQEEPSVFKSCTGCGRMHKSVCLTCDNKPNYEATPIWMR